MHSTTTELLYLSDLVLRGFDTRSLTSLIALDFSKAFDLINHELLLAKLYHYGLSFSVLSLMRSFLINRSQRVLLYTLLPSLSPPRTVPSDVLRALF